MRSFIVSLTLLVGCSQAPIMEEAQNTAPASTCGAQGQPCCIPVAPDGTQQGAHYCNSGLTCDGLAYASGAVLTTAGICGAVGGLHQSCDGVLNCFEPHLCMTTDNVKYECVDPAGGAQPSVCGNDGERCCAEVMTEGGSSPAVWCRVGLRCHVSGTGAVCAP